MSTQQPRPNGPQTYTGPNPGAAPAAEGPGPAPKKNRNVVAIVAFAAAIAGFVFAVWEGAYILGWILLPIAFILSLVALFLRGQPKRMAVAALIIAIVGTVAGGIAFMSSLTSAVDDAFSGGEVTTAPAADPGEDAQGTRQNPYPLGTAFANEEWRVTVNSVDLDAAGEVAAENEFNDAPEAGHTYALVNVTVTYLGEDSGTPMEVDVAYVTGGGNVVSSTDKLVSPPAALGTNELYNGASATGNVALHIPTDDQGVLRVRPGFLGDEVFVALR
ncbi:MAG: hypothetical protein Q4F67_03110 [Propionibacteriaceae bacterium]|nr:hypothetical protein [Propionibacteriaceae bacterium]